MSSSTEPPRSLPTRAIEWVALSIALIVAFLSVWIVVPAPNRRLLPLAVGAPEVSAWLLAASVAMAAVSFAGARRHLRARITLALAAASGVVAAIPFAQFASVARSADLQLAQAFGDAANATVATSHMALRRARPLVLRDLILGMPSPGASVTSTRRMGFAEIGGTPLVLNVYRPADTATYPVVVQIYGGAWQRGSPDDYAEFAQDIAARGYVVFAIDYRHAPAVQFPQPLHDIRQALTWIDAHAAAYRADTARVVLLGRSAGAHLAMMTAYAADAPRVRGVVDFYGPVDLLEGYRRPPSPDPLDVRSIEEAFLGGAPDSLEARYRAASPISLVTRALPPTLLIYGGRDHIVEARFGRQLATALRATGTTAIHIEMPWAEHAFDAVPNGPGSQLARYVVERFLVAVTRPQ